MKYEEITVATGREARPRFTRHGSPYGVTPRWRPTVGFRQVQFNSERRPNGERRFTG